MKKELVWAAKAAALWAALIVGNVAGGLLVTLPAPSAQAADGPLGPGQALLLVNALFALVLAALAQRMAGPAWQRAASLFAILYTAETLLSAIEGVFFGAYLHMPAGLQGAVAAINAIKSAAVILAVFWLWRGQGPAATAPAGLAWKLPLIAPLYVVFYFGAGFLIAWQSEAVRAYYLNGAGIDNQAVALLQLGRGAIWAGLAWLLARSLSGSAAARGILAGIAFAVFMDAPLLYPNPFMPWAVRQVHLVEIGVSNFLFGLLAVWLLSWSGTHEQRESGAVRTTS